jgi:hypothetical protein
MGSHGGATAQGQIQVLARLGITAERLGVPVLAEMEVVQLDEADGIPLFQNHLVSQADGFVLINRVKPHTDFCGPVESGIIKMLVIGLGNQKGADLYHRMALKRGFHEILIMAGRALLEKTRFLFGVAVVENQHHEICDLDLLTADRLEKAEARLLTIAKDCLPRLPLDEIDLLVVDQMGKNFSGAGLDPNVIGTTSCKWGWKQIKPVITRIFVRQLSAQSEGNGSGIGMVDIATPQLVEAIDWQTTGINAYTALCPEDCRVPMTVANEREAVRLALGTIAPHTSEDVKIVHIKNTLELDELYLSEGCLPELRSTVRLAIDPAPLEMVFSEEGQLGYAVP